MIREKRGEFRNKTIMIFFLYGPDDFRVKEKIKELKGKFLREVDASGASVFEVGGDDLNLEKFHELVSSSSLFARRRLLIINKTLLNKNKEFLTELAEYLRDKESIQDNIIIFYEPDVILDKKNEPQIAVGENTKALTKAQAGLFHFLKATPYVYYFNNLNSQELSGWLKAKLAQAGLEIEYRAGQLLVAMLGSDLWSLNNETDKLISYQLATESDNKTISLASVSALVQNQTDEKIFALTDAISNKNRALALKLLEEQLKQGVNEVYIMTMLSRQIKILLAVRAALDNGMDAKTIGQKMKIHPYVLQKSLNQARNFNLPSLKAVLGAMIKMDFNYKTGKLPAPLMMTLLLAKI
jgi:DNA polymerase-3 subunit delta